MPDGKLTVEELDCAPEPCLDEQTSEDTPRAESTHYKEPMCEQEERPPCSAGNCDPPLRRGAPEPSWNPHLMPPVGSGTGRVYVPPPVYEAMPPVLFRLRDILVGNDPRRKVKITIEVTEDGR